jgi:hypothetical protein
MVGTHKDSKGSKAQTTFEIESFGKSYGLYAQERENESAVLLKKICGLRANFQETIPYRYNAKILTA